jgi:hypothetical protein
MKGVHSSQRPGLVCRYRCGTGTVCLHARQSLSSGVKEIFNQLLSDPLLMMFQVLILVQL